MNFQRGATVLLGTGLDAFMLHSAKNLAVSCSCPENFVYLQL